MPDQIVENSPSQPQAAPNSAASTHAQIVGLFAVGLLASFFSPWLTLFGFKATGFDLVQKTGGMSVLFWTIPFFGLVALAASITKSNLKALLRSRASCPFLPFATAFTIPERISRKSSISGPYLGIGSGIAMLLFALRIK